MADGLEHALDLAVAALMQRQLDAPRAEAARLCRRRAPVLELDPLAEPAERVLTAHSSLQPPP